MNKPESRRRMASLKLHGAKKNPAFSTFVGDRGMQSVREESMRGQRLETPRDFSRVGANCASVQVIWFTEKAV